MRTLVEGGDVVAWQEGGHRLLRGGAVLVEDDRVGFVGPAYDGPADRRVDASGKLVIPGFVNLHCHAEVEAGGRLIADVGRRDFFQAGFLNYYACPPGATPMYLREDRRVGGALTFAELLRSGCTTAVEIGAADEALVEVAGRLGIRAYLAPGFRSASYRTAPDGSVFYEWDEARGRAGLDRAVGFIREHDGATSGSASRSTPGRTSSSSTRS
jgi:5-methylthioadenosine/S-adenosylhomocysteine deaminase